MLLLQARHCPKNLTRITHLILTTVSEVAEEAEVCFVHGRVPAPGTEPAQSRSPQMRVGFAGLGTCCSASLSWAAWKDNI